MKNKQTQILIVDDSKDDREMYEQYLSMTGYRVSTADNGKEGLEKAFELQPQVILIDLRLPVIDGWEAAQRLKADDRTKASRIVVITGLTWLQPKILECDGWLTKPCPPDRLGAEIARVLETRTPGT
jgi:CheY-like chemotaxis protein